METTEPVTPYEIDAPLLNGLGQIRVGQGLEPDLESGPILNILPDDLLKLFQGPLPFSRHKTSS